MTCAGIIFSNLHDRNVPELTRVRTMASVPFAGRYRLVDFALSNMVNAGIRNISVIAHDNYHSLMEHIGSGKDWDLARHNGGIRILPPYVTAYASPAAGLYTTRLEALKGIRHTILAMKEDTVVLSDCDAISNLDLSRMLKEHAQLDSDITMVVRQVLLPRETEGDETEASVRREETRTEGRYILPESDGDGNVTDVYDSSDRIRGYHDVCMNIWIVKRKILTEAVLDAIAHNYVSFQRDVILRNLGRWKIRICRWNGYYSCIGSVAEYYADSMALVRNEANRHALFDIPGRPIYTKICNSAPTCYGDAAEVSDSMIADGCVIQGKVDNSILFRGVRVAENTVVRNSILFPESVVGENVTLNCVIADKNAVIRDGCMLSGHKNLPFCIGKGMVI